ncbi:MAG: LuxR family transcriptional regulator [Myxococcales bacterium]
MNDLTSDRRLLGATLAAFLVTALLAAFDVVADLREGTTPAHVATEGIILVLGFVGAGLAARMLLSATRAARQSAAEARELAGHLEQTAAEAARFRSEARELMAGLGAAIDAQFDRWGLSPAEKEVGLLLLKGLSHREVAQARSVTEATARQQARAVYRKAGVSGRADLAAFFLEDLMLPPQPTPHHD